MFQSDSEDALIYRFCKCKCFRLFKDGNSAGLIATVPELRRYGGQSMGPLRIAKRDKELEACHIPVTRLFDLAPATVWGRSSETWGLLTSNADRR